MPCLLRYGRRNDGGITSVLPVPNRSISTTKQFRGLSFDFFAIKLTRFGSYHVQQLKMSFIPFAPSLCSYLRLQINFWHVPEKHFPFQEYTRSRYNKAIRQLNSWLWYWSHLYRRWIVVCQKVGERAIPSNMSGVYISAWPSSFGRVLQEICHQIPCHFTRRTYASRAAK